jgi:hypothetical protein
LKTGVPLRWEYLPVRIVARLGVQMLLVTKARSKRTPAAAMRSRLGVGVDLGAIARQGVVGVVVGHDEDDVGGIGGAGRKSEKEGGEKGEGAHVRIVTTVSR